jgi:hypothetical protein
MSKRLLSLGLVSSLTSVTWAHDPSPVERPNVVSVGFAYGYVPAAAEHANGAHGQFVPGIAVDYFRRVLPRLELGVMGHLELARYVIPRKDALERDRALLVAFVGSYSITDRWAVVMGPGYEIERHKSFPIFRLGAEYRLPWQGERFIPLGLFYDLKEGYNAWSVSTGLGVEF